MSAQPAQREAAADLAIVLATIAAAWILTRWVIYPALSIPDYAPYILRPIGGFLAAWAVLRWRRQSWSALGLRQPASWVRVIVAAVALYLAMLAISQWVVPFVAQIVHPTQRPSFLGNLPGNFPALLAWLAVSWLVGGLCEELLFRGFLLDRVARLLGGGALALALGAVAQALLFGTLHLYAGSFAFIYASLFAVTQAAFFLAAGRNLWPLILVHGAWDSVAMWGLYGG